jgi:hypothetical protein
MRTIFTLVFSLWTLSINAQVQTICSTDPVPAGWITTDLSSTPCGTTYYSTNYYSRTIQKIAGAPYGTTLTICSGDPVPAGWITTATSSTPCRTVGGVSYYSRTIQKISSAARGITYINDSTDLTDKGFAQTHPIEQIALSILIAPNPSKTSFRIGFNGFKEGKAIEYAVYDLTGRLIEAGTISSPGVPKVIGEHYVAGVYILKIRQESFSKAEKFVKE